MTSTVKAESSANPHMLRALCDLKREPQPDAAFNTGIVAILIREGLIDTPMLPSPFQADRGRNIRHLRLTDKGRKMLESTSWA